ncbi:calmodulin-binding-domain-containing protein [Blyttiomyces helicus]|uniref:Calmodulin-binding-domain-containing protein n=1 Tax=Blyttiomyces helicus TaxID=388810 RepID=A0A4P9W9A3_9FUNG|nr:calmodulin-binding-domain-containing protein [Blyttiomyces helicus]|eukprot:RKO89129.1 calmodulin-binding-domain-containing protein [Blyttiomyces helicus]
MEARKTHLRHMAGSAVGDLLKPSRGLRDDIVRAGGTPKDHAKQNKLMLKDLQKANKAKKEDMQKPAPAPFKMKQFEDVPSKLQTRRPSVSNTPFSSSTPVLVTESRPSTASSTSSRGSGKNFININASKARESPTPRTPRTPDLKQTERKTKMGEIPKYLVDRKMEWATKERERLKKLEEQKIPPGMMVMPEQERLETLKFLEQNRDTILSDMGRFPVVIETTSMKRRKAELDEKLRETEAAVEVFSRGEVLVNRREYDARTARAAT